MPGARVASGEQVTLRTIESEDVSFLQRGNNPEIRLPMGSSPRTRDQIGESIEDPSDDRFLVCLDGKDAGPGSIDEDDVRRIGFVSVEDADWKRPKLAYWLVPEFHGEGYGTEAISLAVDYAFRVTTRRRSVWARSRSTTPPGACWNRWDSWRRVVAASSCTSTASTATWCSTACFGRSGAAETRRRFRPCPCGYSHHPHHIDRSERWFR